MNTYLRMWKLINEAPVVECQAFLEKNSPARGRDLEFRGETFFDVDLLEAIRNALE